MGALVDETKRILLGVGGPREGLLAAGVVHITDEQLPKVLLARVEVLQQAVINLAAEIERDRQGR